MLRLGRVPILPLFIVIDFSADRSPCQLRGLCERGGWSNCIAGEGAGSCTGIGGHIEAFQRWLIVDDVECI